MVNYVRTADGDWHRATCPAVRRSAIEARAPDLPSGASRCDVCFGDG